MNGIGAGLVVWGMMAADGVADAGAGVLGAMVESASTPGWLNWVASNPTVHWVIAGVVGWALKIVYDVVIAVLRAKGKSDVQKAQAALDIALKSDEAQDDALAKMTLERAMASNDFFNTLADELEKHKPGFLATPKISAPLPVPVPNKEKV
jgi:hypothetical protein